MTKRRPGLADGFFFLAIAAMTSAFALTVGQARAEAIDDAVQSVVASHGLALEELAVWCDQQGLKAEAAQTRSWGKRTDATKLYVPILPKKVGPAELPQEASPAAKQWHERFLGLRREQAKRLHQLARQAAKARRYSLALDLTLTSVREDPDCEPVRRLLGYQAHQGQWRTAYELRRLRKGYVWSDRFGWILESHLKRYEEGQRLDGKKWISAEEDAQARRDVGDGWVVETEHFTIQTNLSIEAGVALGQELEQLFLVWTQLFFRYYATDRQVRELFEGRGTAGRAQPPRYHVVYFRDRDDYIRTLRADYPNIEMSVGMYSGVERRAYFFGGKDRDRRTMYHEATHQLFQESRHVARNAGYFANFWIMEGIALYMESLHQEDGYYVLGGLNDDRAYAARYRLLVDKFSVPLSTLTRRGFREIQSDPDIGPLYSQMAGLTHFLVHAEGGRYRDALLDYIAAVYNGNQNPELLSQLTGVPYDELDRRYRAFLESAGPVEDAEVQPKKPAP